jgi:hypothetical protein
VARRKPQQRAVSNSSMSELLKNPWTKITGAIIGASALVGIGYKLGMFQQDIDCKLEQIKMQQEFNEKISSISNSCLNEKLDKYESTVKTIEEAIEQLKNRKDEK